MAKTREQLLELDELQRGFQMLQIERESVYMGFGSCDAKFIPKQRNVDIKELKAIRKRIYELEAMG